MRRLTRLALLASALLLAVPALAQKAPAPAPICDAVPPPFTSGDLQDIFETYNREYWDGKLPATVVVWTGLKDRYGETNVLPDGRFVIRLDVLRNREANVARTTILHEMCHVKTWGDSCHVKGAKVQDCSRWLAELHRIMLEGAFDDLV